MEGRGRDSASVSAVTLCSAVRLSGLGSLEVSRRHSARQQQQQTVSSRQELCSLFRYWLY